MVIWTENGIITHIDLYTKDIESLRNTIISANNKREIYTEWLIDPSILAHSGFQDYDARENLSTVRLMVESDIEKVCSWLKEHVIFDQKNHIIFDSIHFEYLSFYGNVSHMFKCATFKNCNINNSTCRCISFAGAKFIDTNISNSYFVNCNFIAAEFENCEVYNGSHFCYCDFADTIKPPYIPLACPSDGGFVGWKQARSIDNNEYVLIKLYIPADAKRSSATGNKCRCSKAKVLDITSLDEKEHFDEARSDFNQNFEYKVGEYVLPNGFNTDRFNECSKGIHFFIDKQDAIDY